MTMQVTKGEFDRRVKLLEQKVQQSANKLNYKEFVERINSITSDNADFNRYAAIVDRINSCFDTNGQFDGSHIAPLSIETSALSVGQRSQSLNLKDIRFSIDEYKSSDTVFPDGNLKITNQNGETPASPNNYGTLTHYTLFNNAQGEPIGNAEFKIEYNVNNSLPSNSYESLVYIYAELPCIKNSSGYIYSSDNNTATIALDTAQRTVESTYNSDHKLSVLLGTISKRFSKTVDSTAYYYRIVDLNYGLTTINGRLITTGRIEGSTQNSAYFDLDTGTIGGKIVFKNGKDINDIEVGGRNLLKGTNTLTVVSPDSEATWQNSKFYVSGSGSTIQNVILQDSPVQGVTTGIKATISSTNVQIGIAQASVPLSKKEITQSVWVKGSINDTVILQPIWSNSSGAEESGTKSFTIENDGWNRYSYTKTLSYDHLDGIRAGYVYVKSATSNHVFYICAEKLEYGNMMTDWSPAPEDLPYEELVKNLHATCDSAADSRIKEIICPSLIPKMLTDENLRIAIQFTHENNLPNQQQDSGSLIFRFKNFISGEYITPYGANSNDVYVTYRDNDASRGPITTVRMPYWNNEQEVEFTYDSSRSNSTNTRLKIIDEAGFDTISVLNKAYKGSTTIQGGAVLTDTVICGTGTSQAGMNGLAENDVVFWAGGSIGNAALGNVPVIITRSGDVKFGAVRIYGAGSGELVMFDTQNKNRFTLKNSALVLEAGKRAYNDGNQNNIGARESGIALDENTVIPLIDNEAVHYFWGSAYQGGTPTNINGDTGASSGKYNMDFFVSCTVNATINSREFYSYFHLNVDMWIGTKWAEIYDEDIYYRNLLTNQNTFSMSRRVAYSNAGNAALVGLRLRFSADQYSEYNYITGATANWTYYQDTTVAFMQIANNGMSYFASALQQFTVQRINENSIITTIKGNVDIPGVLWAGRINSDGTGTNNPSFKNSKVTLTFSNISTGGLYIFTYQGISDIPTIIATVIPSGTDSDNYGWTAQVSSLSQSGFSIRIKKDNANATNSSFNLVLFGKSAV